MRALLQKLPRVGTIFKTLTWLVLSVAVGFVIYFWFKVPVLDEVVNKLEVSIQMEPGEKMKRVLDPQSEYFVHGENLPDYVVGAILVSEDSTFFTHRGIDWFEVGQALKKNMAQKRYARGASTITQQVVKNAFLTHEKSLFRKTIEALTAIRLELLLTKEEILDYYLNLIELGPGVYGLREGARFYFNREPEEISPRQAALLAFFIPSPVKYGNYFKEGKASEFREGRIKQILENMVLQKYLDPDDLHANEQIKKDSFSEQKTDFQMEL